MALRKSEIPLQRHTLNLYEGDFDRLKLIYGGSPLRASSIIRELLRAHLERVEQKFQEKHHSSLNVEVDL